MTRYFNITRVFSIWMIAGLVLCLPSCKPSQDEAVIYNNTIVEIENHAEVVVNEFFKKLNADDPKNDLAVKHSIAEIKKCKKDLQAVPEIKGGEVFKATGIEMLTSYETFFEVDVPKWIAALTDPNRTEESLTQAQKQFEAAKKRALLSQDKFEKTQVEFAKLYEIELK